MSAKKRLQIRSGARGFSLVELLVAVSILVLLAGVVLARYKDFDSITLLQSLAYDVALSIREAQVLGVGVRGAADSYDPPFGVHFDVNTPTQYVLFRDSDENDTYSASEMVSLFHIGNGHSITDICFDGDCSVNEANVLFERPDLDAIFATGGNRETTVAVMTITLSSQNHTQVVQVRSTGQISLNP